MWYHNTPNINLILNSQNVILVLAVVAAVASGDSKGCEGCVKVISGIDNLFTKLPFMAKAKSELEWVAKKVCQFTNVSSIFLHSNPRFNNVIMRGKEN